MGIEVALDFERNGRKESLRSKFRMVWFRRVWFGFRRSFKVGLSLVKGLMGPLVFQGKGPLGGCGLVEVLIFSERIDFGV